MERQGGGGGGGGRRSILGEKRFALIHSKMSHCHPSLLCGISPSLFPPGRNSSVGGVLGSPSCMMQHHRLNPLRDLPAEEIFVSLELTWVLTPSPKKSISDYRINRGPVCVRMHSIARTCKDPDIHVLDMLATKTHPACTIHEDGM